MVRMLGTIEMLASRTIESKHERERTAKRLMLARESLKAESALSAGEVVA